MLGLKGLSTGETGLPLRDELEKWWIEGMQGESKWLDDHSGDSARQKWEWPIRDME